MSAISRETPTSFEAALREVKAILSSRLDLIERDLIDTEAEQIVLAALRKTEGVRLNRVELYSRMRDRIPERAGDQSLILAMARAEGRLLQHLTGYQAFLEHEYEVSPDVLVPRPETEFLVSIALEDLRLSQPALGIEVGAGSGAISLELLSAIPSLRMLASELSPKAAQVARRNAERVLGPAPAAQARLKLMMAQDSLQVLEPFAGESGTADFLISNPPYLASESEVDPEVLAHEPREALFSPAADPVYFYRKFARDGGALLKPGGVLYVEIPHERATRIHDLFVASGWAIQILRDLTGRDRVLKASH
jgi:release factor glutamine methyltransferase